MFNDIQSDFSYTQRKNDPPKPDTRSLEELAKKKGVHIPCDEVYSEDRRRENQMELVRLKLSEEQLENKYTKNGQTEVNSVCLDVAYCTGWSAFYRKSDVTNGECPLCGLPERDHQCLQSVI
jgi:hypothetical protein